MWNFAYCIFDIPYFNFPCVSIYTNNNADRENCFKISEVDKHSSMASLYTDELMAGIKHLTNMDEASHNLIFITEMPTV